jgi:hypothetical protein
MSYTMFVIAPRTLICRAEYDQRLENFKYKNFVAIRNSDIDSIPSAKRAVELAHESNLRKGLN